VTTFLREHQQCLHSVRGIQKLVDSSPRFGNPQGGGLFPFPALQKEGDDLYPGLKDLPKKGEGLFLPCLDQVGPTISSQNISGVVTPREKRPLSASARTRFTCLPNRGASRLSVPE
jgi:hypothetical protein